MSQGISLALLAAGAKGGGPPRKRPRLFQEPPPLEVEPQSVETGVNYTITAYDWNIRNYSVVRKNDTLIEKQKFNFRVKDLNDIESYWEISLRAVSGKDINDAQDWISVRQKLLKISCPPGKEPAPREVMSRSTVKVKPVNGISGICRHNEKTAESFPGKVIVRKKFIPRDAKVAELPLVDGTLTIMFSIQVFSLLPPVPPMCDRSSALRSLYVESRDKSADLVASLEGDYDTSDVIITSKDGVDFAAHRLVLSKKSTVFEAMFRSNMMEKQAGTITCEDLSSNCIKILLHFLYSGELDEESCQGENLMELTYAANKYDLKDLVDFLDMNIGKFCALEDTPNMLVLVNKLGMKQAQRGLMKVITTKTGNDDAFIDALASIQEGA